MTLTGCYDGTLRCIGSGGDVIQTLASHKSAIKCVAADEWPRQSSDGIRIVSGGKDHIVRSQSVHVSTSTDGAVTVSATNAASAQCDSSVECAAILSSTNRFVTGHFARTVTLWSTPSADTVAPPSINGDAETDAPQKRKRAKTALTDSELIRVCTWNVHHDAVTALSFPLPTTVISSSLDKRVVAFDCQHQLTAQEMTTDCAILHHSINSLGNSLLTAHTDTTIRLYDMRQSNKQVSIQRPTETFTSHRKPVSVVEWSPYDERRFASASYDSSVKLWDVRSNKPLQTVQVHSGSVLSIDWATAQEALLSGGQDAVLKQTLWEN